MAANGKLYTLGITEILSCYDIAVGTLIWRKDFSDQFKKTSPDFGTAMSPVVDRGLLIVHVGTSGQGALTALDAATGKTLWKGEGRQGENAAFVNMPCFVSPAASRSTSSSATWRLPSRPRPPPD